jgi:hypothetical protein
MREAFLEEGVTEWTLQDIWDSPWEGKGGEGRVFLAQGTVHAKA